LSKSVNTEFMITGEWGLVYELVFEREIDRERETEREIKYMSRRKGKIRLNWVTCLFGGWRKSINVFGL